MRSLRRLWRGDIPLPVAFWTWAVAGGLAMNLSTSLATVLLVIADRPVAALIAGYAFSVPYNIVAAVGVWRAAGRYDGERRWATIARIAVVAGMTLLSFT